MKKLLSYVLIFISCLTLVGCNFKKDSKIPQKLSKDLIEVEFWHAMGEQKQALIAKIIDNFEREYQSKGYNIRVTQKYFSSHNKIKDKIAFPTELGDIPTIAQTCSNYIPIYVASGKIMKLNAYTESKWGLGDEEAQFIDGFFAEGKTYDNVGTLYSLPFDRSTEVLYYNKTVFSKYGWAIPKTWDEVVKISEEFKQTYDYYNLIQNGMPVSGFSYSLESNLFINFTRQWGGEYTSFSNLTNNGSQIGSGWILFNNDKSKEAMEFFYDNYKAGNMATSTFFGSNNSSSAFRAGQCIMLLDSSANYNHNNAEFEVGVAPCPQKDPSNPQVIQQGTNLSLFKCKDPQEELAGWLFMKYLTNYESSLIRIIGFEEYTNLEGELIESSFGSEYLPTRKDVINSEEYQNYIKNEESWSLGKESAKASLEQLDSLIINLSFDGSPIVYSEVGNLVQELLYDNYEEKDFNKVIDELYKDTIFTIIYG